MKKFLAAILSAALALGALSGCSQRPENANATAPSADAPQSESTSGGGAPASGVTLTLVHNLVGISAEAIADACKKFTDETGIGVEVQAPGSSYEETLKTRMASNTLPDIWSTHGWSVARYSEYLRPLNDQPFAEKIVPSIKNLITDKDGNFFTLPVNVELAGIMYNRDVVEKSGIDVDAINTWDDFTEALKKCKDAGFIPLDVGGKDTWTIGQMFDVIAPGFLTTNESNNQRAALQDGTFDWENWRPICELMDGWNQAGYINVDCLTSDYNTSAKALASGNVGFMLMNTYIIQDALKVNPDVKLGFMPVPTIDTADPKFLIGGEQMAFGMWKDGEHQEESIQLLNFFARPDIASALATSTNLPAGLSDAESDTGMLMEDFEKYASCKTISYFDREFLPSGMWDDMSATGAIILSKSAGAIDEAVSQMAQSYQDKFAQQ